MPRSAGWRYADERRLEPGVWNSYDTGMTSTIAIHLQQPLPCVAVFVRAIKVPG